MFCLGGRKEGREAKRVRGKERWKISEESNEYCVLPFNPPHTYFNLFLINNSITKSYIMLAKYKPSENNFSGS